MKKLTFGKISLFLLLLSSQCLGLKALNTLNIDNLSSNPEIIKLVVTYKNNNKLMQEKLTKIASSIRTKILLKCNLTEKLQLLSFSKNDSLFGKLYSEATKYACAILKIEEAQIKTLAETMQLQVPIKTPVETNKPAANPDLVKKQVDSLVNKIMNISNAKLNISMQLIANFLNLSPTEQLSTQDITQILTQIFMTLTPEELNTIDKFIGHPDTNSSVINKKTANAFAKIADNIDILTEIVLSIIKEEA